MKKLLVLCLLISVILIGCSKTNTLNKSEDFRVTFRDYNKDDKEQKVVDGIIKNESKDVKKDIVLIVDVLMKDDKKYTLGTTYIDELKPGLNTKYEVNINQGIEKHKLDLKEMKNFEFRIK
ncbi:hypothetical protein P5008_00065 [Helcococcus ovis]|uniref:hypothetical protein n=1 Tax=Helcococcus ovis TaxID=72026 RepID=UPI003917396C